MARVGRGLVATKLSVLGCGRGGVCGALGVLCSAAAAVRAGRVCGGQQRVRGGGTVAVSVEYLAVWALSAPFLF